MNTSSPSKSSKPPKIPEEIKKKVKEQYGLLIKGYSKAKFYYLLAKEVQESQNYILSPIKSKTKCFYEDQAWLQTYEFVFAYLTKYNAKLTEETIKVEFGTKMIPPSAGFFEEMDMDINDYFDLCLESAMQDERTVQEKAEQFAMENLIDDD